MVFAGFQSKKAMKVGDSSRSFQVSSQVAQSITLVTFSLRCYCQARQACLEPSPNRQVVLCEAMMGLAGCSSQFFHQSGFTFRKLLLLHPTLEELAQGGVIEAVAGL